MNPHELIIHNKYVDNAAIKVKRITGADTLLIITRLQDQGNYIKTSISTALRSSVHVKRKNIWYIIESFIGGGNNDNISSLVGSRIIRKSNNAPEL